MSRKRHEVDVAGGSGVFVCSDDGNGRAVWDTGSSLYDSYELAAVRRLLDTRLLAAAVGVLALRDEPPPATGETRGKNTQVVPVSRVHHRKVTLRALFRAVATWAARPRQASPLACACAGMVHDRSAAAAAVEPDLPSHGQP